MYGVGFVGFWGDKVLIYAMQREPVFEEKSVRKWYWYSKYFYAVASWCDK